MCFKIDTHLDDAKDHLENSDYKDALQELRKVRRHKHAIERHLEQV